MISPSRLVIRRSFASSILTSQLLSVPERVGIVGGGLAGLSTAYHLLQKAPGTHITIFDKTTAGLGGASSVAGG
jgi:ribulose 1,5-bisphosphate synthetase/thiazole synthase